MGGSVTDFLIKLVNYGEKTFDYKGEQVAFFQKKQIKDIDDCCLNAITEVYDFDACKELFSKIHKLKSPKSCDALKIMIDRETIDFIEIKGLKKFIADLKEESEQKNKEKIEQKLVKFQIETKIMDSIYLLYSVMNRGDFSLSTDQKNCFFKDVQKNYIIVVDFDMNDPRQLIAASLGKSMAKSIALEGFMLEMLKEKLDDVPIDSVSHPKKSLIKTCSTIDKFYADAKIP